MNANASDDSPTRTSAEDARVARPADSGRFAPGSVLANRYRIVALLGRGGMGEVYRADDLKLGQPVALKFLPTHLASDPARLSRFLNEVRVAREVTHPSVCRVHDIGEADGLQFLSMEYVDGEDLASLLRRIGRLHGKKAVEIGRQIATGLAAAHERGVLHRDLKPANVMIDGRGRARLLDFGLAVAASDPAAAVELAGTPAYMAPEQAAGQGASAPSDLYALGLVLYELFTGRRPFEPSPDGRKRPLEEPPRAPSTIAPDIEPGIERAILQCLERSPAARPPSAMAVVTALTGGNALAAALAAGETPAPELVAAAGEKGVLGPGTALALLAFVIVGLPSTMKVLERLILLRQVPLEMTPDVLAHRAAELLAQLGAPPGPSSASGFEYDAPLVEWTSRRGAIPRDAPLIVFWHRSGPAPLSTSSPWTPGGVTPEDPPLLKPGMTLVKLDTSGRLLELASVPEASDGARPPPEWQELLAAAGFDMSALRETAPAFVPASFADRRAGWEGAHPGLRVPVSIEAASHGGRLVHFEVRGPWAPGASGTELTRQARVGKTFFAIVFYVCLAAAGALAYRNLSLGRGDRRGAARLAAFAFVARLLSWLLGTSHAPGLVEEQAYLTAALGRALYSAGLLALLYLAIEPALRRRWPDSLISWSRLLAGRFRDPLVGRDVLVGIAVSVAMVLAWMGGRLMPALWGSPPQPVTGDLTFLIGGTRRFLGYVLLNQINAVFACLIFVVFVLVFRIVLRQPALAAGAVTLLFTIFALLGAGVAQWTDAIGVVSAMALLLFVAARFGFLSLAVVTFMLGSGRLGIPPTLDFGAWYGESALAWFALGLGLALWGAYTSLGGRPLLRLGSLED